MADARQAVSDREGPRILSHVKTEPIIQEITAEDAGYEGDNETDQGLLPDSISEPGSPEDTDVETPEDKDMDFASMPYDEAMLIKGFRKLETNGQSEQSDHVIHVATKRKKKSESRHSRKRSHSQMLSDSESEDDHYMVAPSRSSTPGGLGTKRREIRKLRAVASFPTNHGRGEQGNAGCQPREDGGDGAQASWGEDADADAMDIDLVSSPAPKSETGWT
jgi:hypothetical protein